MLGPVVLASYIVKNMRYYKCMCLQIFLGHIILIGRLKNMISERRQKQDFEKVGNSPYAWIFSAQRLISSGTILHKAYNSVNFDDFNVDEIMPDESMVLSSAMLLYGFAVECLFKATWLKNGNKLVEDGKYKGVGVSDHKLHDLADKVSFNITQKERDVLKRVSIIMTSIGRYPIAKNWNETRIRRFLKGGWGRPDYLATSDFDCLDQIIKKLLKQFDFND